MRPWDKKFIDTIFAPNDSLCTALKSAYDNKLKDTQVGSAAGGWWAHVVFYARRVRRQLLGCVMGSSSRIRSEQRYPKQERQGGLGKAVMHGHGAGL